jgi:hypothetical protein
MPIKLSVYRYFPILFGHLLALTVGCGQLPPELGGPKHESAADAPSSPPAANANAPTNTLGGGAAAPQDSSMMPSTQTYPLATLLSSKSTVKSPYGQQTLVVPFAVTGGDHSFSTNDFRFYCKRENQSKMTLCPENHQYKFNDLKSGQTYTLTVQAVSVSTGMVAQPDQISFTN